MRLVGLCIASAVLITILPAWAGGDAEAGKAVFNQCRLCHSLAAGTTLVGPSLHGVFGREAGTMPNFRYSPAMVQSGIVWNEATLALYLPDPQAYVHHTKMTFLGVKDPKDLEDVIAFLKQATK